IMKPIFIFSSDPFSGKTALALAIGKELIEKGYRVGYFKPIYFSAIRTANQWIDEDTLFVQSALPSIITNFDQNGIFVTPEKYRDIFTDEYRKNFPLQLDNFFASLADKLDILLIEGGATFQEGHTLGISAQQYVSSFGCCGLLVIHYQDELKLFDTALFAQSLLGENLKGIIINRIPLEVFGYIAKNRAAQLEELGVKVIATIPEDNRLAALTVIEVIELLHPQVLTKITNPNATIENLTIGAMTAEAALSRFRKQSNKAVITGGDRTDIQLAALETSTTCLILTGNLHPSPLIIRQAEDLGVPILLVASNTMETIESLEKILGKTRLGQPHKLQMYLDLFHKNVDLEKLFNSFELDQFEE
ncbi:MAG: DRTGG domain-containing protein, partial [Anaerolineales bacterium]